MTLVNPTKIPHSNFNLYYAGTRTNYAEDFITNNGYCRLLSYVNERRLIEKHCEKGRPVFVDSGAFSAATRGIKINVDDYIAWLNKWHENMVQYCCWDVIPVGDIDPVDAAQQTWDNYLYMRERLVDKEKLVYCYHYGEPVEYLHQALEFGCTRIALGGMAKRKKAERKEFLQSIQHEFKDYPNVRVHAFGMTDVDLLKQFRFIHSADSTSWLWPAKFSEIQAKSISKVYFSFKNEKTNRIDKISDEKYYALEDELAEYGFKVEDMVGEGDPIKNRDVWQIMFWQERFFTVAGGTYKQNK